MHQHKDRIEFLPHIVVASCGLHNFLINSWLLMLDVQEDNENDFSLADESNEVAESLRDALTWHIHMVANL